MAQKLKYARYKQEKRREKNKLRRMKKYSKKNPNDLMAYKRIQELQKEVSV
jgi:hypothetical protein